MRRPRAGAVAQPFLLSVCLLLPVWLKPSCSSQAVLAALRTYQKARVDHVWTTNRCPAATDLQASCVSLLHKVRAGAAPCRMGSAAMALAAIACLVEEKPRASVPSALELMSQSRRRHRGKAVQLRAVVTRLVRQHDLSLPTCATPIATRAQNQHKTAKPSVLSKTTQQSMRGMMPTQPATPKGLVSRTPCGLTKLPYY